MRPRSEPIIAHRATARRRLPAASTARRAGVRMAHRHRERIGRIGAGTLAAARAACGSCEPPGTSRPRREPTTASLMARGAYSNTGTPCGMAHSAAPRAWPSFSALSTLRLTNTRSTATSAGCVLGQQGLQALEDQAQARRRRGVRPRSGSRARRPRAVVPRHLDDAEAGAPRTRVEPEDAHVGHAALTRAAAAAGSNARQDLVRYLDIRIYVPYFVQLFEGLEQCTICSALSPGQLQRGRRALGDFARRGREAAVDAAPRTRCRIRTDPPAPRPSGRRWAPHPRHRPRAPPASAAPRRCRADRS